jgi:hypothetical protein
MRIRSRQSARTVRPQRSATAFAFGAWTGVRACSSPSCMARLRACWVTQPPSGFGLQAPYSIRRVASEMTKRTEIRCRKDGLDGEEVAGQHARRRRPQEGSPRRPRSLRRRLKTCLEQR